MSKTLRELTIATLTVTGDFYHVSGADLLDKRITIDDITTGVRSTLKGPLVADGNMTIETGGLLLARSNEDVIQEIGRVKVWGAGDIGYVSHYDFATAAGAGWQQNASGDTYLNAASGRTAGLRIANADILTVTGTLISLKKATTIAGDFTQTTGVTSLKATTITGTLTAVGDITQTSGVTSLKATTIAGNLTLDNGVADGGNLVLKSLGFSDINLDSTSGKFRLYTTAVSTAHISIDAATKHIGLNTNVDNTIDDVQIGGSLYASTYINATSFLYVGDTSTIHARMNTNSLKLGNGRTSDGTAVIDFITDTTYPSYGFRIIKQAGEDGGTQIIQRGNGGLSLISNENRSIILKGSADYATFSNTAITLEKPVTVTSGGIKTDNAFLLTKVIEIGDWNMDTTSSVTIAHGLTKSKIRTVTVFIRDDSDVALQDLTKYTSTAQGGFIQVQSTNISCSRITGGLWDGSSYDSTSYNRGHITIEYEA